MIIDRERLRALCPGRGPTPLRALPQLAGNCGVGSVWIKDESQRPLGNFKSLGGVYAAVRALERAGGDAGRATLLCASDGNHGLAVAAGAQLAGARAKIFLPEAVVPDRVERIRRRGAEIVRVAGTYDDAVAAAAAAAGRGEGRLIADTSADPADPGVADVMAGYAVMADEMAAEFAPWSGEQRPTHLFVQAGVGGLAAALARGLQARMAPPGRVIVVEPAEAACVGPGLRAGRAFRIPGELETEADMLSCGEASAPALRWLAEAGAEAMTVSEAALTAAVAMLAAAGGPVTTPSGAAGLAGLCTARATPGLAARFELGPASRVLLIVTEAPIPRTAAEDAALGGR